MTEVVRRRRKSGHFDTMLWDGTADGGNDVANWMRAYGVTYGVGWTVIHGGPGRSYFTVPTLEGRVDASPGSLIVRGPDNDFWPVADGIWQRTYEDERGVGDTSGTFLKVSDLMALDPNATLRISVRFGSLALTYAKCVDGAIYLDTEGWDER